MMSDSAETNNNIPLKWERTVETPYSCIEEKDHFAAMGLVANEWAWLEFTLDLYIIEMLGLDEEAAACLTAQVIGSGRKLDAYIAACRLRSHEDAGKTLEKFAKDTSALAERRNRIIHDSWIIPPSPNSPHRFEITARRTLRKGTQRTETSEVMSLAFKLSEHCKMLETIHNEFLTKTKLREKETNKTQ